MSAETKRHQGTAGAVWALLALALWLSGAPPARAQIRPASDPIVNSRLQRIVEMIPGAPLDLPPYLANPKDVYLLVTAGASYTDIQVLANPEVPPQTVARALSSALAGTPLRGQTVEWSADRYSAAQVSEHHSRFGALRGSNTVPVAPLMSGLRQAGLTPHLLLRVPAHDQTPPLPLSHYGTRAFRWYDVRHLGNQGSVTVTARMTGISLARILAYYLLIPVISLLGLRLAHVLSSRGQRDDAARRLLFRSISTYTVTGSLLAQVGGMVYLLRTPTPAGIADLWFGSSTTTLLVPFLVAGALPLPLFLLLTRRQEIRRFGPVPTSPAIPMSDEEKAVRQRVARYSMMPHLIGAVALGAVPFFVTRTSPLYPFIHPVAMFLPMVGAGLVGRIFQKRLDRFTQKTVDQDLTWRARQIGQTLGVRMPDVFVEDSSRAAHLAFASHQGHHITLSRKLQGTFTPEEMDFVLAHHLACMKRRGGISGISLLLGMVLPVPFFAIAAVVALPKLVTGVPSSSVLLSSAWFLPALFGYVLFTTALMIPLSKSGARQQAKKLADADRDALEVTGNLTAAESALEKFEADTPPPTVQVNNAMSAANAETWARVQAGRISIRRVALQKTAQELRLAPAPGTEPA